MLDKLLALISIICFAGFVGILVFYVREPDLTIICVAVVLMAVADFFLLTRKKSEADSDPKV
ncbi:MAG: hypothetical protein ACR2RA_18295 [Geminicoccaceae bacterium]